MIDVIFTLPIILLTWLCGLPVYFFYQSSAIGKAGMSFIIGSLMATFSVFISYWLIVKEFSLLQIVVTLIMVIAIESIVCIRFSKKPIRILLDENILLIKSLKTEICKKDITSLLVLIIGFVLMFSLVVNWFWPIHDWDALALYDFRAKVMVTTHTFSESKPIFYFYHYPPYTSLLHSFTYFSGSAFAKVWYSLLFASFLATFYSLMRLRTSKLVSLVGTAVLATSPMLFSHSTIAYTNLPFTILISLGLLHMLTWIQTKQLSFLLLGALLIGYSQWIRITEPFWLLGAGLLFLGAWRNKKQIPYIVLSLFLIVIIRIPWSYFVSNLSLTEVGESVSITQAVAIYRYMALPDIFSHLQTIWIFFFQHAIASYSSYLWLAAVSVVIVLFRREKNLLLPAGLLLVTLLFIFFGMILFSQMFPGWQEIPDSMIRMSMLLIPLSIYTAVSSLGRLK